MRTSKLTERLVCGQAHPFVRRNVVLTRFDQPVEPQVERLKDKLRRRGSSQGGRISGASQLATRRPLSRSRLSVARTSSVTLPASG